MTNGAAVCHSFFVVTARTATSNVVWISLQPNRSRRV